MGEYQHTVDAKGRLIIPSKFREALGNSFVITRGLDNCLFGYPMNEWRKLEEKLKDLPMTKKMRERLPGSSSQGLLKLNWINKGASTSHRILLLMPNWKKNVSFWESQPKLKYGQKSFGKNISTKQRSLSTILRKILSVLTSKRIHP